MKIRTFQTLLLALLIGCGPVCVQSQGAGSDNWVDYVSGDYDIQPNVTYATANGTDLKLDLYLPKGLTKPSPTLVLFHGGGWVEGAKERNIFYLLPYLSMGWTVVNVEYRLAKNSPAPAAVEDCRCSLRWLVYHAKEYNIDTSRIVLTGTSAGGHLSLIAGMLPPGSVFDRQCPTTGAGKWNSPTEPEIKVAAIVNWFGITDVADLIDGPNAKHYAMEWLGSRPDRVELAKQLSPLNWVRPGTPPVITIQGDEDDIAPYPDTVRFHGLLDKAGVPNRLITIKGKKHGGFDRQQMISSYAAIREFLKKNKVLQ